MDPKDALELKDLVSEPRAEATGLLDVGVEE